MTETKSHLHHLILWNTAAPILTGEHDASATEEMMKERWLVFPLSAGIHGLAGREEQHFELFLPDDQAYLNAHQHVSEDLRHTHAHHYVLKDVLSHHHLILQRERHADIIVPLSHNDLQSRLDALDYSAPENATKKEERTHVLHEIKQAIARALQEVEHQHDEPDHNALLGHDLAGHLHGHAPSPPISKHPSPANSLKHEHVSPNPVQSEHHTPAPSHHSSPVHSLNEKPIDPHEVNEDLLEEIEGVELSEAEEEGLEELEHEHELKMPYCLNKLSSFAKSNQSGNMLEHSESAQQVTVQIREEDKRFDVKVSFQYVECLIHIFKLNTTENLYDALVQAAKAISHFRPPKSRSGKYPPLEAYVQLLFQNRVVKKYAAKAVEARPPVLEFGDDPAITLTEFVHQKKVCQSIGKKRNIRLFKHLRLMPAYPGFSKAHQLSLQFALYQHLINTMHASNKIEGEFRKTKRVSDTTLQPHHQGFSYGYNIQVKISSRLRTGVFGKVANVDSKITHQDMQAWRKATSASFQDSEYKWIPKHIADIRASLIVSSRLRKEFPTVSMQKNHHSFSLGFTIIKDRSQNVVVTKENVSESLRRKRSRQPNATLLDLLHSAIVSLVKQNVAASKVSSKPAGRK